MDINIYLIIENNIFILDIYFIIVPADLSDKITILVAKLNKTNS